MSSRRTATDRREGREISFKLQRAQIWASVANNVARWAGGVGIVFFAYKTVATLAGETTVADIGIKVLADVRFSEVFAWIFGASGVGYGWRQRKLRRDTIERLSGRQQALEKGIDPKRSSSELTTRGDTNPEDRL